MRHPLADTPAASVRRSRFVSRRVAAVAVAVVAGAIGVAAPATAHDALVASDPAADATVTAAPTQVVLTFSAAQTGVGSEVLVTGADGQVWSDGPAQVADTTVTQPLTAPLPDGAYTVTWRSVAGDGHPVTGAFGFTVAVPVASPVAPTPTDQPTESVAPAPEPSMTTAAPALPDAADAGAAAADAGVGRAWVWAAVLAASALVTGMAVAARRRAVAHD